MLRRIILATLTMLLTQGCSTCEPMAEDYDRSCQVDNDCEVVFLHRDCDCPDVAAVNVSEVPKVNTDNKNAQQNEWCPLGSSDCGLAVREAFCDAGTCHHRAPTLSQE